MQFIHEELTAKIIEACFEVSNELGAGFWNRSIKML